MCRPRAVQDRPGRLSDLQRRAPTTNLARSVNAASPSLSGRIGEIQDRIALAARRSGRDPGLIALVGVIKKVPLERAREAMSLGLRDLGENRVQEAAAAIEELGRSVRWHMIGNVQRNK